MDSASSAEDSISVKQIDTSERKVKLKKQERKRLKKQQREEKTLKKFKPGDDETDDRRKKGKKDKNRQKDSIIVSNEEIVDKITENQSKGRHYTVSIAVSGSIVENAQSAPLKAYLCGQVARSAAIYHVDEIIVFDDTGGRGQKACEQMARVLQYMECPQYLRKSIFPMHSDLTHTGVISPLNIPHHLRRDEALPYREGIVTNRPTREGKELSFVYVGLEKECQISKTLPQNIRVTVKFNNPTPEYILSQKGKLKGEVVSPNSPRTEMGLYWGYSVRIADSLSKVFSQSTFPQGYDVTIGTSEKGTSVDQLTIPPSAKHILIVFGGVEGLEYALENDEAVKEDQVEALFDHYLNTCPNQGSRTIRTEEAILISLATIRPKFIS